jgi:hypothetical protein
MMWHVLGMKEREQARQYDKGKANSPHPNRPDPTYYYYYYY